MDSAAQTAATSLGGARGGATCGRPGAAHLSPPARSHTPAFGALIDAISAYLSSVYGAVGNYRILAIARRSDHVETKSCLRFKSKT
ncbi:hypothetical protein EVAR_101774_1 [Eumeta japonica]|uniref:Uncharacterized protein n=1 Tax=Eumeta variegata TaxID=151549 RepID=A0A4C1SN36_EUMVA|nr:hypothetical protein EVAR_101774_1 [Eumeta japonica]